MRALTISQVNNYMKKVLEEEFVLSNISLVGEISETRIASGNTFFTLVDGGASISCVCFERRVLTLGDKVSCLGSVRFNAKNARITFAARAINSIGDGQKQQLFLALKRQLAAEGLFTDRLPLPKSIDRIAIVTSPTGAVIHDFVGVARKKNPMVDLVVYPVRVQGEGSEQEIATAIGEICRSGLGFDVIVLARGGGAVADLASFNTEVVARAVAASTIPIVSAIGHETDYTLADFAAGTRAGTPSIAAELTVFDHMALVGRARSLGVRATRAMHRLYEGKSAKLRSASRAVMLESSHLLRKAEGKVFAVSDRLKGAIAKQVERRHTATRAFARRIAELSTKRLERIENQANRVFFQLDKASPMRILASGYALVTAGGRRVMKASELSVGDSVSLRFADGCAGASINSCEVDNVQE